MATEITEGNTTADVVLSNVREIAAEFAKQRSERQRRSELDQADFDRLRDAGFLLTAVPSTRGGIWEGWPRSTRPIGEMLRSLGQADSSLALVAAMHPAVIRFTGWLDIAEAPEPHRAAWEQQREWAFNTCREGHWWGTITSEPGSGGDVMKTKAIAKPAGAPGEYVLSGEKHFGSGSGMSTYMVTTALPEGEDGPDTFFVSIKDKPWDGSQGIHLIAPWDGQGMTATQSHGMRFTGIPAIRLALPDWDLRRKLASPGGVGVMFTAVIVGIVDAAMDTARQSLAKRKDLLRAYEQVAWAEAEIEAWTIAQAYEGVLRAVETNNDASRADLLGKQSIAIMAESLLNKVSKVIGGGAYSRYSPFSHWFEDVRALGFLRPPWGLAYDTVFSNSWAT